MPVLIILLFYIHDLVKIKRYYLQSEFAGQQVANILQNIYKGQPVTHQHIKYAAALAWLSIYPGKTMYSITGTDSRHELSNDAYLLIYYVKGMPEGKATVKWGVCAYPGSSIRPKTMKENKVRQDASWSTVRWGTNVAPSSIYPTLKINEGEIKILMETQIVNDGTRMNLNDYVSTDDQATRAKKAFNLRLISPKSCINDGSQGRCFSTVVIFTPKPGLFSETAPS